MARTAGLRDVVGLAVAGLLLGACAHGVHAGPSPGASRVPEPHRTHRPYSDVNPPSRHGGDFTVKVLVVTRDDPRPQGSRARQGRAAPPFWGEEVRTCLRRSSRHRETVGWEDWRAAATDGRVYRADPHATTPLRRPAYPVHQVLSPGQCATGYWLITVPRGADLRAIRFAPDDGPVLIEWPTLR
jgi:hypothetical protein